MIGRNGFQSMSDSISESLSLHARIPTMPAPRLQYKHTPAARAPKQNPTHARQTARVGREREWKRRGRSSDSALRRDSHKRTLIFISFGIYFPADAENISTHPPRPKAKLCMCKTNGAGRVRVGYWKKGGRVVLSSVSFAGGRYFVYSSSCASKHVVNDSEFRIAKFCFK